TERVSAWSAAALCIVAYAAAGGAQEPDAQARLAALETELATLERDIGLLEDTKAIKRLQRAYGYYVDKKLSREIGALFADDPNTTAELGGSGVYVGRARIAEFYDRIVGGDEGRDARGRATQGAVAEGLEEGELFNHMILQGVVHVAADGRTAKGRWRALIQIGEHGESATWAEGPYENEYVKEDGVWKFSKVHWYQTFSAPYSPGWHKAPEPMNPPLADFPPDRPPSAVYQSYPSVHQPPYHYANPASGRCEPGVCVAAPTAETSVAPAAPVTTLDAAQRVAALRPRLAAVETRATRVADINEIENLQGSYGYYTDKMLWDEVVDLFADDGTLEIGPSGVYAGKDSIRRYLLSLSDGMQGPLEGVLNDHFQLQPIVTVAEDGQTANGRWRLFLMTGVSGAGSGGNWGEGVYENEYVKENGVWKIRKLHWYATFVAPYEGGWLNTDRKAVEAYATGRGVTPDRPSSVQYEPYPGVFVPPFHYPNPVSGRTGARQ
ncbi:MAG TPA: nuclear transport factor 2 family protein, partial [Gammaproteobacteria bacterium]|nr:nuclear transport factor 2 family protein [Gammaproteobacteria bacterium]